jgi:hypothetical protein
MLQIYNFIYYYATRPNRRIKEENTGKWAQRKKKRDRALI